MLRVKVSRMRRDRERLRGVQVSNWETAYIVRLDNGAITYVNNGKCAECGWQDTDFSFFYEREGNFYCSLHKDKEQDSE